MDLALDLDSGWLPKKICLTLANLSAAPSGMASSPRKDPLRPSGVDPLLSMIRAYQIRQSLGIMTLFRASSFVCAGLRSQMPGRTTRGLIEPSDRGVYLVREAAKVYHNARHSGHLMPSVQTTSAMLNAMAGALHVMGIDVRRGLSGQSGKTLETATRTSVGISSGF